MSDKLGVESLKNLATVGFGIVKAGTEALADGFQPFQDSLKILPALMPLASVFTNKDEIVAEWNDRDNDEKAEIIQHISTTFSIENKKAEAIIEDVLAAGIHLVSAFTKYQSAA